MKALFVEGRAEATLEQLEEAADVPERGAQVVRDRIGEGLELGVRGLELHGALGDALLELLVQPADDRLALPLGELALGDVGERDEYPRERGLVARVDREVHRHVSRLSRERLDDGLFGQLGAAIPQADELARERVEGLRRERLDQPRQQLLSARGPVEREGGSVHLDDLHQARASLDDPRVVSEVGLEVGDALCPQPVEHRLHLGEVLLPERDGGILEEPAVPLLALTQRIVHAFALDAIAEDHDAEG